MPSLIPLLEAAAADLLEGYAAGRAECLRVGLAAACYAGVANPLTTVKGLGPRIGEPELAEVEDFYAKWGASPVLELAPWVDEASLELLRARGYAVIGEEDVMLRATGDGSEVEVESVKDVSVWARGLALAFNGEVNEFWMDLGVSMGNIEGSRLVGVWEEGELVAMAQLVPGLRVATFCCDGTLEAARGKGYQRRLIEARQGIAQELGLGWCTSEVAPGSSSQRNYVRCGFEKAYSRQHWKKN